MAGSLPSLVNQFCPGKGIFILTPVIPVGLIKDLFLWNLIFCVCVGYWETTFCNIFLNLKCRRLLQSLEMCFTTHSLWTAHTFVIKDRKLLAMEKYGDALQNGTVVYVLFKKPTKILQETGSTACHHDYSSMCGLFCCNSKAIVSFCSGAEGRGYWEITICPFLLAESWTSLP